MYQFSRSIYRDLRPHLRGDEVERARAARHVLEASEATVRRLALDGRYFARPARALFTEIRGHFGLAEQTPVYAAIERHLTRAREFFEAFPEEALADGEPRRCPATTRKGTQCQRTPLPGREYCPSHSHLEEIFGLEEPPAA